MITFRCPLTQAQDGRRRGVQYDSGDRYCLDGSRLVLTSGVYGADGSTYGTELDTFSRAYALGTQGAGPQSFLVRTKNNRRFYFGTQGNSRVKVHGDQSIHEWKLDSVSDYTNNVVNILYVDNAHGFLVESISYKDMLITFEYEARNDVSTQYFNGGVLHVQDKRLKHIKTFVNGYIHREIKVTYIEAKVSKLSVVSSLQLCSRGPKCYKPVELGYQGTGDVDHSNSLVNWISAFGVSSGGWSVEKHPRHIVDVNDDGLADVVGFSNGGILVALNQNGSFQAAKMWVASYGIKSGGWHSSIHPRHVVDVNGDHLPDILGFANNGVHVSLNTGSESFTAPQHWLAQFGNKAGGWAAQRHPRFVKDINGDGLPDIVGFANDGVHVSLGTGTSFQAASRWIAEFGYAGGWRVENHPRFLEDVNGDGLPDVVGMHSTGIVVSLNAGSSFRPSSSWGNGYFGYNQGWRTRKQPRFVLDVNGDGLADVVGFSSSGVEVSLSTGASFLPSKTWIAAFGYTHTWRVESHPRYIHDMNGDGLPDVVGFSSGGVIVALNTGSLFTPGKTWVSQYGVGTGGWSISHHPRYLVDVTGDGISDIVGIANAGVLISTNNNKKTLMTAVTDSYGNTHRVLYSSIADRSVYARGETSAYPDPNVNVAQTVVKQFTQSNGVGGLTTSTFIYKGMRVNLKGRGALGFKEISETRQESEESFTTKYFQSFPLTTLAKSVTRQVGGKLILLSNKTYSSKGNHQKQVHLINDVVQHYELNGMLIRTEQLSIDEVDNYGNIKVMRKITTGNGKTFEQTTLNSYSNKLDTWYIGELHATAVTYGRGSTSSTRKSTFYYNRDIRKLMYELREPDHHLDLKTSYVYDCHGNVIEKHETPLFPRSASDISPTPRSVFMTYDSLGNRLMSIRNYLGHVESYTYDRYGNMLNLTGANALITTYTFDAFDRKISEVRPDGTSTRWKLFYSSIEGGVYAKNITRTGAQDTLKIYDSLARPICIVSSGFGKSDIYEKIEYDPLGHVKRRSVPHFSRDQQTPWVTFQYDKIGREVAEERPLEGPAMAKKQSLYNGLVTDTIDAKGNTKRIEKDALGRIIQVTDALNGTVKYEYDAVGNLLKTTDPAGNTITMTYDQLGDKISIDDPDMGLWQYSYDAHGQKLWQKDSVGNEVFYTYDKLGRLVETQELEGTTKWIYDQSPHGKGKLAKTISPNGHIMEYMYDSNGREEVVRQHIGGEIFDIKSEYNDLGQLSKQTLPGGKTVHYCFDDQGFMTEVSRAACDQGPTHNAYWRALSYDSFGHIAKERYGNSLLTDYSFDASNHLKSIETRDSAKRVKRHWEYKYDAAGNMLERKDLTNHWNTMETFSYDALERVVRATIKSLDPTKEAALSEDWEYDSIGNLRRYSGFGGLHHQYSTVQPHALVKAGPNTYAYDANGNIIRKNNQHITWTSFNKPKTIETKSKGIVEFEYDAEQNRFKKSSPEETVIYIGKLYEKTALALNRQQITHRYFIYALGRLVTIDSEVETESGSTSSLKYLLRDHLDSVDTVTNDHGEIVEYLRFNAFGQRRTSEWANFEGYMSSSKPGFIHTKRGFTGHEHLGDLHLIHMNGRIYDPTVGRFLSPDPHVQDPYNTQSYNRYSYTLNNPLKHKDPSGYFFKAIGRFFKKFWRPIVAVAATVVTFGAATPLAAGLVASAGMTGVTATVATGALAGAASGFVGGTITSGSVKGGVQGAFGGAVSGGLGGYFGSTWDLKRVITQAIGGGVATEFSGGEFKDGFLMAGVTASAHYLYNSVVKYDAIWKPGGPAQIKTDSQMPIKGANNVGTQGAKTIDPSGWFNEGGRLSRFFNKVPGVNAVAGMHDVFQVKLDGIQFPYARDVFNVPGMLPAAAISYTALLDGPASQALLVEEKRR